MVDTHNISFRIPDGSGGSWSQNVPRICRYENGSFVDFKEVYVYTNGDFHLCWQKGSGPQRYYNYKAESNNDGRLKIINGADYPVISSVGLYVGIGSWEMNQGGVTNAWYFKLLESIEPTFTGAMMDEEATVFQGVAGNYTAQIQYPDLTLYDGTSLPSSRDGMEYRKLTLTFTNPLSLSANKQYAIMANRSSRVGTGKLIVYETDASGVEIDEDGFSYIGNFGNRQESPASLDRWNSGVNRMSTLEKVFLEINGALV